MICSHCGAELDEDRHDDHETGCTGPPCSCDVPSCPGCCRRCQSADDHRYGLLLEVLVVLVLTAWAATAAVAAGRGGERLEPTMKAGETSEPVIFTGETGP